jgi:hypothetical protein
MHNLSKQVSEYTTKTDHGTHIYIIVNWQDLLY